MGESTMVTPSSPEPSSEDAAVPEAVALCLHSPLVITIWCCEHTLGAVRWAHLLDRHNVLNEIIVAHCPKTNSVQGEISHYPERVGR